MKTIEFNYYDIHMQFSVFRTWKYFLGKKVYQMMLAIAKMDKTRIFDG